MNASKLYSSVALIIGILILANLVSDQYSARLDLTEGKRYTLSDATRNILKNLDAPVTVTAYFSEGNLPPYISKIKRDFKDMLVEYASISDGMVQYEFVNPDEEEKKQEAAQAGVQQLVVQVREQDQMQQRWIFMGATVELGEQKEVMPAIGPNSPVEYLLTTAIKKLSVQDKPVIGLLQGHGEPGLQEMYQVVNEMSILYNVEPLTLEDTAQIPAKYKAIAIVDPKDTIPSYHVDQLDEYLSRGGRIFLALNRVKGDLSTMQGTTIYTGLENWLNNHGVEVSGSFLIDANCGNVTFRQPNSIFGYGQAAFPYLPFITNFADHPVSKGLEQVMLAFSSPVRFNGDSAVKFTPVAISSEHSGEIETPVFFDIRKQWTEADFNAKNLIAAATWENMVTGGKMVIIGDGDFPVNGAGQQASELQPDQVSLMANSIDWLADDTGLIELRTKGATTRPIKELEDSTRTTLKVLNVGLPMLLILVVGVVKMQVNRKKRNKRKQIRYS